MKFYKVALINVLLCATLCVLAIYSFELFFLFKTIRTSTGGASSEAIRNPISGKYSPTSYFGDETIRGIARKHKFFPLALKPYSKVILCNEGYGWISYATDSLGFRNSPGDWSRNTDFLLIGDSFTLGQCVEDGHDISGVLKANNFHTLNLGHGGTNPYHYSSAIQTFASKLKPKNIVINFYIGNDFRDFEPDINNSDGIANSGYVYDEKSGQFILTKDAWEFFSDASTYIEKAERQFLDLKSENAYIKRLRQFLTLKNFRDYFVPLLRGDPFICENEDCLNSQFAATNAALTSLQHHCNWSNKCNPIVVLIEDYGTARDRRFDKIRRQFSALVSIYNSRGADFKFLDTRGLIAQMGDAARTPNLVGHLSVEAYQLLAIEILKLPQ
jgi:hypothetical protein